METGGFLWYNWGKIGADVNIAVIFAGGVGKRMGNTELPKQFMEVAGKPILIHTLEIFERHPEIDGIVLACLADWIDYAQELINKYGITKVRAIVPGGETGQMSIFQGVNKAHELYPEDSVVLIHDGVRPFIDDKLISNAIKTTLEKGSAISCVASTETFVIVNAEKDIQSIPERSDSLVAKAPQAFRLGDIYNVHLRAQADGVIDSIDSCTLMYKYGQELSVIMTDYDNVKITTPKDIALAESIYERRVRDAK